MIRKQAQGIQWLEFEIFSDFPELVHGIFLRHGGVSGFPYTTLNAGSNCADEVQNVVENCRRMRQILHIPHVVEAKQVHGDAVVWVRDASQEIGECDALITQKEQVALMIKHADCQAAVIYDPVQRALANVHSGWRGNVKNIYRQVVEKMAQVFGSQPKDLLVGVSPSLGPEHAEFKNYRDEFPEAFWKHQVKPAHFDLWQIAREQFEQCGVLPSHIEIARICTYTNPQDYFSYRRDGLTGRHATFAMLF